MPPLISAATTAGLGRRRSSIVASAAAASPPHQFGVFAVAALGVSGWAATSVYGLLAAPITSIERALVH